jgi:hypothetical protein
MDSLQCVVYNDKHRSCSVSKVLLGIFGSVICRKSNFGISGEARENHKINAPESQEMEVR